MKEKTNFWKGIQNVSKTEAVAERESPRETGRDNKMTSKISS